MSDIRFLETFAGAHWNHPVHLTIELEFSHALNNQI